MARSKVLASVVMTWTGIIRLRLKAKCTFRALADVLYEAHDID